ncbi:indole-2-monooxygenase-like [Phragmites australis]|uniref:indole-2-monooxygenase-like n=1 Tax=Phragmites australis TaxID=29695 RepID=UPI002D79C0B6|nr:indole-2-monooxygenase-like [Phragmites australis]
MAQVWLQVHHALHGLLLRHASSPKAALVSVLLLCPVIVLLLVRRSATATSRTRELLLSNLPSPPGKLPVIGHLHLIGSLPHVSLADLAAKHGRDGLLLLRLGAVPTLIVSSPRAAQAVLRTHDHVFASRAYSPVTDILFYGSTDVAFSPYGEHWRQVKKIATTHLLTNRKVRSYRHAREQEVRLVVGKIREAAAAGTAMDLSNLLNAFANDIVCHAVSGKFFREEGRNKLFRELVEANSSLMGGFNLEDYFPVLVRLDVVKRMVCAKAQNVNKMWDDLLEKLINGHASKPASECDGDDESDFIDVLLSVQQEYKLTREHIKAQLVIMFEAGTDTSFIVMEYAMVELMQNPHLMKKLQAEVRMTMTQGKGKGKGNGMVTEDDISGMAYLKAVIKETLRFHSPAPLLAPHLSMADCDIEGYTIPSGTRVIVNSWALARDPSYWESAEEFMPERFMEGGSAAAMDYKGNDIMYLPFGTGRRMCPGINFAISTVEVMLANLVYHFNWELPPGLMDRGIDMTESFGLTVHRTEKLLLLPVLPQD